MYDRLLKQKRLTAVVTSGVWLLWKHPIVCKHNVSSISIFLLDLVLTAYTLQSPQTLPFLLQWAETTLSKPFQDLKSFLPLVHPVAQLHLNGLHCICIYIQIFDTLRRWSVRSGKYIHKEAGNNRSFLINIKPLYHPGNVHHSPCLARCMVVYVLTLIDT